jgi:hypothetical protein
MEYIEFILFFYGILNYYADTENKAYQMNNSDHSYRRVTIDTRESRILFEFLNFLFKSDSSLTIGLESVTEHDSLFLRSLLGGYLENPSWA